MSGKLGDTNGNNLLDINEVWIYTCTTTLTQTTTNTVQITAFANGLKAVSNDTITVNVVGTRIAQSVPKFPSAGTKPDVGVSPLIKITVWTLLFILLAILFFFFMLIQNRKLKKVVRKQNLSNFNKKL
jgi:hypothetical protein